MAQTVTIGEQKVCPESESLKFWRLLRLKILPTPRLRSTALLLLQRLGWRCVECAINHERDVREEQHPYIRGENKQKRE